MENTEKDLYKNLKPLGEALNKWIDTLDDENPGIDMVVVANDTINGGSLCMTLTDKEDSIGSCFNAFNKGFAVRDDNNENNPAYDALEGAAEFFQRLCAENEELWESWKEGVEYYKQQSN